MSPEALEVLQPYHWSGNIRELENIAQRAIISDGIIAVTDLPVFFKYQIEFPEKDFVSPREMEKEYVKHVLLQTPGNKTKAAKILQIGRKTLRAKLN